MKQRSEIATPIGAVAILAFLALLGGCKELPLRVLEARKANVSPPRFVNTPPPAPSSNRTVLLFIHGIFGDTYGTWCNENGQCLPNLILDTPEMAGRYDAFVFGFPSSMFGEGSFTIPEAAKNLESEIKYRKMLDNYSRIVIVGHSMGGLVALEALTSYPDIASRVPLVVTYGTPYTGAQVSTLGERILNNPALADMVPIDAGNSLLTSLTNRWKTQRRFHKHATRVVCAYETVAVPPLSDPIVPESAGVALCDEAADAIADDHLGIVKPNGIDHLSYKVLVNALRTLDTGAVSGGPLVDMHFLILLAQVADPAVRIELYKKHERVSTVESPVLELLNSLQLSGNAPPEQFTINLSQDRAAAISDPAELAALATNSLPGLPCGGTLNFQVANDLLACQNGEPLAIATLANTSDTLTTSDIVVFHSTFTSSLRSTMSALTNGAQRASYHIVIDRDGSVVQLVPFNRIAWHAGASKWGDRTGLNRHSIGVGFVNAGRVSKTADGWTTTSSQSISDDRVESRLPGEAWEKYTPAQIAVASAITSALAAAYGVSEVVGHCHISPSTKEEPGPYFPFGEIAKNALGTSPQLPACGRRA